MKERKKAINWWCSLSFEQQFYKVIDWLSSDGRKTDERHPSELTDEEIEKVYNLHKRNK